MSTPFVARGLWDYISATRLNTWLSCPLKFKLKYIDQVPSATTEALRLGKAVHAGLEWFYRNRQAGTMVSSDEVARRMERDWALEPVEPTNAALRASTDLALRQQAIGLVRTYLKQLPTAEPPPLAVEFAAEASLVDPISGENLGIPLVGILDLVLPDAAGPIIADFKTTSKGGAPLEIAHEIQLSCYAYLLRSTSSAPESGLEIRNLVKTKVPQVHFHRYAARSEQHFTRLFGVIRAYLDDLEAKRFVFRPGFGCAMCEVRQTCCRDAGPVPLSHL